jgi:hypothetical protein
MASPLPLQRANTVYYGGDFSSLPDHLVSDQIPQRDPDHSFSHSSLSDLELDDRPCRLYIGFIVYEVIFTNLNLELIWFILIIIIVVPLSHYVRSAQHVFFFHPLLSLVISIPTPFIHVIIHTILPSFPRPTSTRVSIYIQTYHSFRYVTFIRITCPYQANLLLLVFSVTGATFKLPLIYSFLIYLIQSIHLFLGRPLLGCPSTFMVITLIMCCEYDSYYEPDNVANITQGLWKE